MPTQTVEDLGKLVKSKHSDVEAYKSLSDIELGQKVKAKYPDAYGSFTDMPDSAMSRFGTGLYNTTVGPVVNAVQHPIDTLSNAAGVPQLQEAWNQAKQGNYAPAAMSLVEAARPMHRMAEGIVKPIASDIQQSNYAGAAGQVAGLGLGAAVPELAGKLGASKLGVATGAGLKAGGPSVAGGAALVGGGELLGKAPGMEWPARVAFDYPGAAMIKRGLVKGSQAFGDAWKGPKVEAPKPPEIPVQKGPTVQQLKTATMNGTITPEQFDAHIDGMKDLTPDNKALHKSELRSSMQSVNPPSLGQTETGLSLGTAKNAVKAGDHDINWFKDKLKQKGHTDESIEEESNQLKREIETEKAAKEEAKQAEES